MDLFYTPSDRIDLSGGTLTVEGEEFFHITKVLRKNEREVIHITDGMGLSVTAEITKIGRNGLTAAVTEKKKVLPPSAEVTVALSLLKSSQRFDFFLEKATELGVAGIVPMITERTVSQPKAEKRARKLERWKKVVVSAALQTKRYHFPEITAPLRFDEVVKRDGYDSKLIAYETSEKAPDVSFSRRKVLFLVGGEGGFTGEELEFAVKEGFREISFGHSILRAETAGIFAVAMARAQIAVHEPPEKWL